ncbi:poly(ADP-ribose) glycohydrolase-like isoform X4 [Arapaima gigas]
MAEGADYGDKCLSCGAEKSELRRLRLENQQLRRQIEACKSGGGALTNAEAEICESDSGLSRSEHDKLDGQKVKAGPEEATDMNKHNDSSQVKALLTCDGGSQDNKSRHRTGRGALNSHGDDDEQLCQATASSGNTAEGSQSGHPHPQSGPSSGQTAGNKDQEIMKNVPLSEMKKLPACHMELEKLSFSKDHTVLVNVHDFYKGQLIPQKGHPRWDSHFVKMPYSDENVMHHRWKNISKYLSQIPRAPSTVDVENVIKKYNPKYKDQWSFDALHCFFKSIPKEEREAVSCTMYRMAKLALNLPEICPKAIPLLRQGHSHAITLSQLQIACLLANAFYCTFPHRNATHRNAEYSNFATINFSSLFTGSSERKEQKFKALFIYFKVVTDKEKCPHGLVTFQRCYLFNQPDWKRNSVTLSKLHISSEGTIEEKGAGMLQVDFACSLVGGGVLGSGLVQEEILFLTHPELIVARLFTERLDHLECLKITGVQQYSNYTGYSDSFRCTGSHLDNTKRDEWNRLHRQIVAIDAMNFKCYKEQFTVKNVLRELNKAYCGFQRDFNMPPDYLPAVATGKWGCGAFSGDPKLKALIQLMAAAVAQRDVAYFTFKDYGLEQEVQRMHHFLVSRKVTVGEWHTSVVHQYLQPHPVQLNCLFSTGRLYQTLENYFDYLYKPREPQDLYSFIRNSVTDTTSKH